jgi:hypothetical protein
MYVLMASPGSFEIQMLSVRKIPFTLFPDMQSQHGNVHWHHTTPKTLLAQHLSKNHSVKGHVCEGIH